MPPIKSPVCAKGHAWSKHGKVVEIVVKGVRRTRRVCITCTKAYQKQYKRPKK